MQVLWAPTVFEVDLNTVRDENRVVTLLEDVVGPGPAVGNQVLARDEDLTVYDARVDEITADGRVYLRVIWSSARVSGTNLSFDGPALAPRVTEVPDRELVSSF